MNIFSRVAAIFGKRQSPNAEQLMRDATAVLTKQKFAVCFGGEYLEDVHACLLIEKGIKPEQVSYTTIGLVPYVRPKSGNKGSDIVGIGHVGDIGSPSDFYVTHCVKDANGMSFPKYMKLADFCARIGDEDVVQFFDRMPRPSAKVALVDSKFRLQ